MSYVDTCVHRFIVAHVYFRMSRLVRFLGFEVIGRLVGVSLPTEDTVRCEPFNLVQNSNHHDVDDKKPQVITIFMQLI